VRAGLHRGPAKYEPTVGGPQRPLEEFAFKSLFDGLNLFHLTWEIRQPLWNDEYH
jgi:hypothetical protein